MVASKLLRIASFILAFFSPAVTPFSVTVTATAITVTRQKNVVNSPSTAITVTADSLLPLRLRLCKSSETQLAMSEDDGPDPSRLISAKNDKTQQLVFASSFVALAIGASICVQLWHGPGQAFLGAEGYETIRGTVFPIAFGAIFALVGVAHFVFVDNFARMVPPKGTWGGLWQAPSPLQENLGISYEEYHSYWSGLAECIVGVWLLAAGLGVLPSTEAPAFLLFLLTIAVTPSNLYMFTHDATPGGIAPRLAYPAGHIVRFVVQCVLLSNFWIMAHP